MTGPGLLDEDERALICASIVALITFAAVAGLFWWFA